MTFQYSGGHKIHYNMKRVFCKFISLICILIALVHSGQVTGNSNICVEKVTDSYGLSEGPHWDHHSQKLYFVDIFNQYIRRLDPATGVVNSIYIENGPIGVAVPVDGSHNELVAGVGKDIVLITWDGEENEEKVPTKVLCSVEEGSVKSRINDGKVDSSGRFWLGTTDVDDTGHFIPNISSFYRIDSQNDSCFPEKKISSISLSNGLTWNIKDDTFYYIDSLTYQVAAYDYEPYNGTISNRRIVFDLNNFNFTGIPDGMTIDTDDNLWIALHGGSHVINVDPRTGKILRAVKIPVENVSSVTFGGSFRDVLFVTTSSYGLTAEQREASPYAGAVFAVKGLGVRGNLANTFRMN